MMALAFVLPSVRPRNSESATCPVWRPMGSTPDVLLIEERSLLVRLILLRRGVPGLLEVATPELDDLTGLSRCHIDPGLGDDRVLICSNDHGAILQPRFPDLASRSPAALLIGPGFQRS